MHSALLIASTLVLVAASDVVGEAATDTSAPAAPLVVLPEQAELELGWAFKGSLLTPEAEPATTLWRMRADASLKLPWQESTLQVAYEQRLRQSGSGQGAASPLLLRQSKPAYRLWPLDEPLLEKSSEYSWRHELDRAQLSLHLDSLQLTVGRQAVGWGRGVFFSAVDVFAPFAPLEIDREWRRGIDAVRVDLRFLDAFSLDVVAAFGDTLERSAFVGRVRGFVGPIDGELIAGYRAGDGLVAATLSATVFDAEFHGELALYFTPEAMPQGGTIGFDRGALKAVLGASYTFALGNGLSLWLEYLFCGFGSDSVSEALARLQTPAYLARYERGDLPLLGKHAVAARLVYPWSDRLSASVAWMASPSDGSGVITPSAVLTLSDNVTLTGSVFLPHGSGPDARGLPQSEYGATPLSGFIQLALYY